MPFLNGGRQTSFVNRIPVDDTIVLEERLQRIVGYISAGNITMKAVTQEVGFDLHFDKGDAEWKAEMNL
jgi:hypothetical protein